LRLLFWLSFAAVFYAYFGYALFLKFYALFAKRPVMREYATPSVSVIIAARNEEANLPAKLADLARTNYPKEQLTIVIASDGSTDRTPEILAENAANIVPIILAESQGKATALNAAVERAAGEILVFLDARQTVDPNAIAELVSCFADPTVGAVSGELVLENISGQPSSDALGIYWKIEKVIRKLESSTGSVVGVTGAIYALRRELYSPLPKGTILDDVMVPMNVARKGRRVVFQPLAIARDRLFSEKGKEFSRKVRTLTGNYQLLRSAPWLFSPANPLLFRFISHKLMRLPVPLLLVLMLVASALAGGMFYRAVFLLEVIFYLLAASGTWNPSAKKFKPVAIASTFVMLNAAAAMAFYNFALGRKKVWVR
jgi:poly-beta-1,6-N-acetyl-D-glucosamine synthase